jgi:hypothetical protein
MMSDGGGDDDDDDDDVNDYDEITYILILRRALSRLQDS